MTAMRSTVLLLLWRPLALASLNIPTKEIAPGVNMPVVSIGSGGLESRESATIVSNWMALGGRGVDTAFVYRDQDIVGKAIRDSGVQRESVFITTKIPGCFEADTFIQKDLELLGVEYVDLMLIHSPVCEDYFVSHLGYNCSTLKWDCPATWATLEKYHSRGVLKSIGVSNWDRQQLEHLLQGAAVVPAVNQIQLNVLRHDDSAILFSQAHNITVEAYSPLGRSNHSGDITGNHAIQAIAKSHNVSTYQVAMKWILQHGHTLTFQSTSSAHQRSDADLFSFELKDEDMATLDHLQGGTEVVV